MGCGIWSLLTTTTPKRLHRFSGLCQCNPVRALLHHEAQDTLVATVRVEGPASTTTGTTCSYWIGDVSPWRNHANLRIHRVEFGHHSAHVEVWSLGSDETTGTGGVGAGLVIDCGAHGDVASVSCATPGGPFSSSSSSMEVVPAGVYLGVLPLPLRMALPSSAAADAGGGEEEEEAAGVGGVVYDGLPHGHGLTVAMVASRSAYHPLHLRLLCCGRPPSSACGLLDVTIQRRKHHPENGAAPWWHVLATHGRYTSIVDDGQACTSTKEAEAEDEEEEEKERGTPPSSSSRAAAVRRGSRTVVLNAGRYWVGDVSWLDDVLPRPSEDVVFLSLDTAARGLVIDAAKHGSSAEYAVFRLAPLPIFLGSNPQPPPSKEK
jgi:hypothetical protein